MPMFYTPKPRQFRYQPRFYDPEKEKWEALKQKYADERMLRELEDASPDALPDTQNITEDAGNEDTELAYFQQRVREMDREEKRGGTGLTWKDLFRKREMPTFNYQPRFATADASTATAANGAERMHEFKKRSTKIKRRFDVTDKDYMKPIPATRIMLYTLLVCLLLYWILF
ncbi:MAG: hypothetical protein IJ634_05760 [Bacteroidales bacterium]|nr:hypothetical protein [Bacteroidales bacterium]